MSPQTPHPALKEVSPQQWAEMSEALTAYSLKYMRKYYGDKDVLLPGGFSAADISQEIVLRVLNGARKWDPDQHGDLLDYMVGQVRSIANHCIQSWSGRHEFQVGDKYQYDGGEVSLEVIMDQVVATRAKDGRAELRQTEQIVLDEETRLDRQKLMDTVLEVSREDPDFEALVFAYYDSPLPRRRLIAERTGKTPEEITNLVKRLRRKVIDTTTKGKKN